jgi:hypothetical protein
MLGECVMRIRIKRRIEGKSMFRKAGEIWEQVPEPKSNGPVLGGAVVLILIALALLDGCNGEAAQGQTHGATVSNTEASA